ncbi:MAG: transketolase [Anaerolineae bacterium]|nr:transketolase [Anaerolineae bacterium]
MPKTDLDQRCINALRVLAMDGVQRANSGHPGMPMGMADVAYTLWSRHMKHNPQNPKWPNRDRFVLSAGHGSMLLYSLLYLTGYPISMDDLKQFRQWGSKTAGHPEYDIALGIETTTGPLGQGFGNGVGMAIAARHMAARFNRQGFRLFDHWIYAIVSDGDLMEGVSQEAASLAGHLGLDNIIYFYDDNEISIEGSTDLAFTEDVPTRFRANGWHVQVIDGHDMDAIDIAIRAAKAAKGQPHLIVCHTHIAYGSPNMRDSAEAHGAPLGEAEVQATKEALGWPSMEPFWVPDDVIAAYRVTVPQGERAEALWHDQMNSYEQAFPEEAKELHRILSGRLPENWLTALPQFKPTDKPIATRSSSGKVIESLAPVIPELIGGSADLAPSTRTYLSGFGDFSRGTPQGRNFHFGVREHGMGAILNGMALYGGIRPYGATFLIFSDYMRPSVRLAALMGLPVIYVWTHDSIFVGEDGPTHEPIEQIMSLRLIPNLATIRPADANETAAAWKVALERTSGPTALALSRQNLPTLAEAADKAMEGVARGGYILSDSPLDRVDIILIATGSEVADALAAQKLLQEKRIGARVVSMPCWLLFDEQPLFYRLNVLPSHVIRRLAIEAGTPIGWERYVGSYGAVMGINRFGASAPAGRLKQEFGFTAERIAEQAQKLMAE